MGEILFAIFLGKGRDALRQLQLAQDAAPSVALKELVPR